MISRAQQVARLLLQIKAIKLSPQQPFTWASGIQSPIYCDNRLSLSYPEVRAEVIAGLVELSGGVTNFDMVAGVATAGIPHGALLADRLGLPFAYIRDKPKSHGRQNQIEGKIDAGARVLVIEDLISTGGSSLKAVEAIREHGAEVAAVMAIFTYGFPKASVAFGAANCPLLTITDYETMLHEAVAMSYIGADDLAALSAWRQQF